MANEQPFAVGDIVQLKSNGPRMTVTGVEGQTVYCTWFSPAGKQSGDFPAGALVKPPDPKPGGGGGSPRPKEWSWS